MSEFKITAGSDLDKSCIHEFGESELTTQQGIVFDCYTCKKCNGEVSRVLGERFKPDMKDITLLNQRCMN